MKNKVFILIVVCCTGSAQAKINNNYCAPGAQQASNSLNGGPVSLTYWYTVANYDRYEIFRALNIQDKVIVATIKAGSSQCMYSVQFSK